MSDSPQLSLDDELPFVVAQVFHQYAKPLLPDKMEQLWRAVKVHLDLIQDAQHHNEFVDLAAAQAITERLELLLDGYAEYTPAQQALIVGAARYFVESQDAESDLDSVLGLEDDMLVLNLVLEKLDLSELKIKPL